MPEAPPADPFSQAKALFFAGLAGLEAQRFEEAEQHFVAALALVPGRLSTLVNLAATRLLLGRPEAALPIADEAIAIEPDSHDAWLHRASALAGLSRHAEALAGFERALALKADQPEVWSRQAQTLDALGRPEDALRSYERALAIDATLPEIWSRYGEALREQMRLPDAAHAFRQALAHGADPELHGYMLASVGGALMPARAPSRYVRGLFDAYAADFDQHLVGVLGYQAHALLTRHLALLARGPFDAALDLGCGTGLCGPLVKPHVRHLTGVDLSDAMLARAGALGVYNELVQGDLLGHLQTTPRRYELVLAADVFIYVGALDEVFSAVRGATLPGAVFCFTAEIPPAVVPNVQPGVGLPSKHGALDPTGTTGTTGAIETADAAETVGLHLLPSLRYAHSEGYLRRLAARHGFSVLEVLRQPVRHDQRQPVDGLYLYLVRA